MSKKTQTNFKLGDDTKRKLAELAALFGNKTLVVELAIDRMYNDEIAHLPKLPNK